jgi:hypothetical protein
MHEDLVKTIISQILAAPELQALLLRQSDTAAVKPGCLIVLNHQDGVRQLPAIAGSYPGHRLAVCIAGPVELAATNISRVTCEQARQQTHWACLQVPVCTPDQLAHIALGLSHDPTTTLVAWAIAAGLPVEIGQVQWGFTDKTPAAYRQLFVGYIQQSAAFGVTIADLCTAGHVAGQAVRQTPPLLAGQSPTAALQSLEPARPSPGLQALDIPQSSPAIPSSPAPHTPAAATYTKRLLSDKEAVRLTGQQVVHLSQTTVLTPGAIDIFKQHKIEVYREGVRCI